MTCIRSKNKVSWKCIEGNIFLQDEQGEAAFICSASKYLLKAFHIENEDAKFNQMCFIEILNFLQALKDLFRHKRVLLSRYVEDYTENFQGKTGCSI